MRVTLMAAGLVGLIAAPGWAEPSQDGAGPAQPSAVTAHPAAKRKNAVGAKPAQAPAPVAAKTSGEVDSVNLPGVRLPGPKSRAGDAITRPVAGTVPSSPVPFTPQAATGAPPRDTTDPDRKYPGGGVMTGDVSIGGPLGAGPFGR